MLFTECWHSKLSNIEIDGYSYISCPRPKFNSKAKRNSGGVIVYFKNKLLNFIELVSLNENGYIWFKLKKQFLHTDNDAYICTCYIPPQESSVYKNINSTLFEYDFFQHISHDTRYYNNLEDVHLYGDINARTSQFQLSDCINNIHLDRYVDLPYDECCGADVITRAINDPHVNPFGHK